MGVPPNVTPYRDRHRHAGTINSHFGPERDCVVSTSRSITSKFNGSGSAFGAAPARRVIDPTSTGAYNSAVT